MVLIHQVEQGTPEWFAVRLGIPTASNFAKIITSTGKVPSERIAAEFGGYNMGMDAFRAALKEAGLSLEYNAWRHGREWFIAAKNARAAFAAGIPYTPRVYGIGSRALCPSEEGCEQRGKMLQLVEYMPAGYADGIPYGNRRMVLSEREVA